MAGIKLIPVVFAAALLSFAAPATQKVRVESINETFHCWANPATNMQVLLNPKQLEPISYDTDSPSPESHFQIGGLKGSFLEDNTSIKATILIEDESCIGMNLTCAATFHGNVSINVTLSVERPPTTPIFNMPKNESDIPVATTKPELTEKTRRKDLPIVAEDDMNQAHGSGKTVYTTASLWGALVAALVAITLMHP